MPRGVQRIRPPHSGWVAKVRGRDLLCDGLLPVPARHRVRDRGRGVVEGRVDQEGQLSDLRAGIEEGAVAVVPDDSLPQRDSEKVAGAKVPNEPMKVPFS